VHHSKFARTMSLMGHSRRFTTTRCMSALPPIATSSTAVSCHVSAWLYALRFDDRGAGQKPDQLASHIGRMGVAADSANERTVKLQFGGKRADAKPRRTR
jgi:hypothetical protein